ncbi:MAG: hypothetical protein FWG70_00800 [Oscillospiraceae bacterium]|nr:hypothetical protein [Oscillospiraceae bacterium]
MKRILKNYVLSLKSNVRTIISAVIISAVLWLSISLQIFPDVTVTITDIPIRIYPPHNMIENNLRLAEQYRFTTNAEVRGKRYDVGNLGPEDFEATLNLAGVTEEGDYEVGIDIRSISQNTFEIQDSDTSVRIKVERIESKVLELIPVSSSIRVAEGMQIDESSISVNPSKITIRGEKGIIDSITRAEVYVEHEEEMFTTLSIDGELRLFNRENVWISNPDVIYDNEVFSVTVPIHKVRTLPLRIIITGAPSNFDLPGLRMKMEITPHELTLSAPDMSIDLLPFFDVGDISLNDIDMQMLTYVTRDTFAPKLPEGYKNISGLASYALSFNDVDDYAQFDFPIDRDSITVLNKPVGFDVEILTRVLTVTVVGPASYVQAMSVNDINVTLNLINIPEITNDSRIDSRRVQCRIEGELVPAWVIGYPQVDVSFTKVY